MIPMMPREIADAVGGKWLRCPSVEVPVTGVSTDSRTIRSGQVFFPLVGERFDGHRFVGQTLAAGAAGAVVRKGCDIPAASTGFIIEVDDTRKALGRLAAFYRGRLKGKVLAVTGSNGKTTTKEMISCILKALGKRAVVPQKSFNNEIGLPLTLFTAESDTEFVVVELGTNHPGEIARLTAIARPDGAVVTNIGPSHLEAFGDMEGVMAEKSQVFLKMDSSGFGVLNFDDARCRLMAEQVPGRVVSYGTAIDAKVRAVAIRPDSGGGSQVRLADDTAFVLPVPGRHNVLNSLAALGGCQALGIDILQAAQALAGFTPVAMRFEVKTTSAGITVINDAYNANPRSMTCALEELAARPAAGGRKVCILGDMRELGPAGPKYHQDIGRKVAECRVDLLVAVGDLARHIAEGALAGGMDISKVEYCSEVEVLVGELGRLVLPGDTVLVKGSRGMELERVASAIETLDEVKAK